MKYPKVNAAEWILCRGAAGGDRANKKIDGIAPGDYDLFAWQSVPDGAYHNSRFMSRFEDRARHRTIGQSSANNQDLVVLPALGR